MSVTVNDAEDGVRLVISNSPYDCSLEFGTAVQMRDWAMGQINAWANESASVAEIASAQNLQLRGQAFQFEVQQFTALKHSLEQLPASERLNAVFPKQILEELGQQIAHGDVLVHGQPGTTRVLALKESDPEAFVIAALPSNTANAYSYRIGTQGGSPLSLKSLSRASIARFPPTLQSIDPAAQQLNEERNRWGSELVTLQQHISDLNEANREVKALEQTYREGLKLAASVTYWTSRARWQTAAALLAFGLFVGLVTLYVILAWLYVLPFVATIDFSDDAAAFSRCAVVAANENEGFVIGLFTAVLAFSTIGLWRQTKRLAEGAKEQAADTKSLIEATKSIAVAGETSAAAALQSTRLFAAKERAYLIPANFRGGIYQGLDSDGSDFIQARVWNTYYNIGGTAARIYETRIKLVLAAAATKPDLNEAKQSIFHGYLVLGPNESHDGDQSKNLALTVEQLEQINEKKLTLFAVGSVTYKTVFDTTWTRVFTMKFKPRPVDAFVPTQGDLLNFELEGYYAQNIEDTMAVLSGSLSGQTVIYTGGKLRG